MPKTQKQAKKQKVKSRFQQERETLKALHDIVKKRGDNSDKASSLITWYLRNQFWTDKQFAFAQTLVTLKAKRKIKQRKTIAERKHHLYAISDGESIKLGYSCNIGKRIKALQTATGRDLSLVWKFYVGKGSEAARRCEKQLHRFCKKHHIKGEWYRNEALEMCQTFKPKTDPDQ